ncbi:MAG: hypothetical protein KY460_10445 [Actinobacteria bacterium]|nr:hypothetical protein [Actinomycetota bacterium]
MQPRQQVGWRERGGASVVARELLPELAAASVVARELLPELAAALAVCTGARAVRRPAPWR